MKKDSFLDNAPRFNSRFKRYLSKRDLQNMIFDISENLTLGYRSKEMYLKFNKEATEDNYEAWFKTVLAAFKKSHISEYDEFVSMLERWETEILNSFKRPYGDRKLSNALSEYLKFNKEATEDNYEAWFKTVLAAFKKSHISEYDEFVSMLERWETEILNSFKRPYGDRKLSNALSENINGKIRTYLSISNGITNFIRFRKRCLFALNHKIFYSITSRLKTDKSQGKPRGKYNKTIDNKQ